MSEEREAMEVIGSLDYRSAVVIGSYIGELTNRIEEQQKEIDKLKKDIKDMMTGYEDWEINFADEN